MQRGTALRWGILYFGGEDRLRRGRTADRDPEPVIEGGEQSIDRQGVGEEAGHLKGKTDSKIQFVPQASPREMIRPIQTMMAPRAAETD
jgi:hypothetical protein